MSAKAPRQDGKGYAYPVMGYLVGWKEVSVEMDESFW